MSRALIITTLILFILTQKDKIIEEPGLTYYVSNFIKLVFEDTIKASKIQISKECYDTSMFAINEKNNLYTYKFMKDSAKNFNDLGTYQDCYSISYKIKTDVYTNSIRNNLTYTVFNIENKNMTSLKDIADIRYESANFMLGSCFIKGCKNDDLRQLFYNACRKLDVVQYMNLEDIEVLNIDEGEVTWDLETVAKMSPLLFFIILFIFSICPSIPVFIFKKCFKKSKKKSILVIEPSQDSKAANINTIPSARTSNQFNTKSYLRLAAAFNTLTDKCKLTSFKQCFDLAENGNALMGNELKDNGLNITSGLRAIVFMLAVIGCVFKTLYLSPIKIFCSVVYKEMITRYSFSIIIYGLRTGPRMLFALSGYILVYKIFSYLDDHVQHLELNNKDVTQRNLFL